MNANNIQPHPAARSFPMMDARRFEELKEDISTNGQRVAIVLCDGMILDGRNRMKACWELGIEPRTETYQGDPWSFVWSLNGQRRDLADEQRYLIWKHCSEHSEEWQAEKDRIADEANEKRSVASKGNDSAAKERKNGACTKCTRTVSKQPARKSKAAASKTNKGAVARGDMLAKERPDLAEQVRLGKMKPAEAHRRMRKEKLEQELAAAKDQVDSGRKAAVESVCDLRVCSCAELFKSGIKPDAVVADPPYPQEFLPVLSELAEGCKAAGVPLVAVMCGQTYLPEVMARLCAHLKYRWTMAYLTPGGQAVQQWQTRVNSSWKPVLVFGDAVEWLGDVATSKVNDNDKRFHDWGQSESGMADLVRRLTKPGQLVCDPFLGGGTTAIVSLALGRRFVGCDIDAAHVEQARSRVLL